jgi:hypothetical protein
MASETGSGSGDGKGADVKPKDSKAPEAPAVTVFSPARTDTYRYTVQEEATKVKPLASVEAYWGNRTIEVHNISQGGMALICNVDDMGWTVGDDVDMSVSIRERAFPVKIHIRSIKGARVSCSFQEPPAAFLTSLKEFLGPKFLGAGLKPQREIWNLPEALGMVEGSMGYEAFVGANQTGVFVWLGKKREVLHLMAVARDLVLSWVPKMGTRTGRLKDGSDIVIGSRAQEEGIAWDRKPDETISQYMTDILCAWLQKINRADLMEKVLSEESRRKDDGEIIFPVITA